MSAPMAHLEGFLEKAYGTPRWATIDGSLIRDDKDVVAHMTYRWLHAVKFALEDRDEPGDRIVADFIHRMTNGSYGELPNAMDFPEARDISALLYAARYDEQITDEEHERLEKRLLGGKW